MANRPSTPLLTLILDAARKKGWNTSTLAQQAGLDRSRLKQVLAGREPMTVDELMQLSEAMTLTPMDLGLAELDTPPSEEASPSLAALPVPDVDELPPFPDPFGIHSEQILRLGFALGVDVFLLVDTTQLEGSGVPASIIKRFQPNLPIRLEAAYHRHNNPEYFTEGFQVRLSFDALYTCLFPWSSIQQITLFPIAPEPEEPDAVEEPPSSERGGFLRLVE